MEGQFAAQALLVEQQRRIKALEAELATTQMELMRLRNLTSIQPHQRNPASSSRTSNHLRQSTDAPPTANVPSTAVHVSQSPQVNDDAQKKASSRYWTPEEHARFLEGLELFGQKDIKAISRHVGTRSATQVRTHAQKYYLRIERERAKAEVDGKSPASDRTVNGKVDAAAKMVGAAANGPTANGTLVGGHLSSCHTNSSSSNQIVNAPTNTRSSPHDSTSSIPRKREPALASSSSAAMTPKPQPIVASAPTSLPNVAYPSQPFLSTGNALGVSTPSASSPSMPLMPNSSMPAPTQIPRKPPVHTGPVQAVKNGIIGHLPETAPAMMAKSSSKHEALHVKAEVTVLPAKPPKMETTFPRREPPSQNDKGEAVKPQSPRKQVAKEGVKRTAPGTPRRSPKKRAKKPASMATQPPSSAGATSTSASVGQPVLPKMSMPIHSAAQPPKPVTLGESGGSMSNLRALLRVPSDEAAPSASKPPTLRRNGSSNSVLADLSKNMGVLSRSNSFISPSGKGVTRSNSILSLLSGIPTALRDSPSTDRLLGLDNGEDKMMATLKAMDNGTNSNLPALGASSTSAANTLGAMGDRSFSFGQLNHMGLDDLEDPGAVALALQEDQKWGDG